MIYLTSALCLIIALSWLYWPKLLSYAKKVNRKAVATTLRFAKVLIATIVAERIGFVGHQMLL